MASALSKALRTASIAICLLVAAYFVVFALNQTSTASGEQQEELGSKTPAAQTAPAAPGAATAPATTSSTPAREGGLHRDLDEAAEALTAPMSGLASQGGWGDHALRLIFALLLYGFALAYIARVLRVRT